MERARFFISRLSAQRISSMLERTTSGDPPCDLMEDSAVVALLEAAFRIRGMIETATTFQRYCVLKDTAYNTYFRSLIVVKISFEINSTLRCLLIFVDKYREKNSHS